MIIFWVFLIARVATIYLLSVLLVKQYANIIVKRKLDELTVTRTVLALLTTSLFFDSFFRLIGQLHSIAIGVSYFIWLEESQLLFLIIRIICLYAIYRLHKLVYDN